jgi:hypothetical protein
MFVAMTAEEPEDAGRQGVVADPIVAADGRWGMGPQTTRLGRLESEYRELRDDERQWSSRAVNLGSFYLVVVGTTVFYLLQHGTTTAIEKEAAIGFLAPIPSFGITAIIVRQAVTATIRSRLLLAYERAVAVEAAGNRVEVLPLESDARIPIGSSFHAQQRWLQGGNGWWLAWIERLGLVLVVGICYLCVAGIHGLGLQIFAACIDGAFALILVLTARDGLPRKDGFHHLEGIIAVAARETVGAKTEHPRGAFRRMVVRTREFMSRRSTNRAASSSSRN